MEYRYIILKRFGTLELNKKVLGHQATSDLWHVYYGGGWHSVSVNDVEELD